MSATKVAGKRGHKLVAPTRHMWGCCAARHSAQRAPETDGQAHTAAALHRRRLRLWIREPHHR